MNLNDDPTPVELKVPFYTLQAIIISLPQIMLGHSAAVRIKLNLQ